MMPPLAMRLLAARRALAPVTPRYRILYEAPAPASLHIIIPSPHWLAAALAGGVLPPIEARLADAREPGRRALAPYAAPIDALTETEAMHYLALWQCPPEVWGEPRPGNRRRLAIVPFEMLPTDRAWRNAWTLRQAP